MRVLTPDEALKLIATCDARTPIDLRDRALIIVGLETGMHCVSLAGMRLEAIKRCRAGHYVVPVPIKGSKEPFAVPLSDVALAAIEPWRAWLRSQKIVEGPVFCALVKGVARSGKLVYEPAGDALSRVAIYKIITRRAKKAGLRNISPLLFRRSFIAWRAQAGLAPYKIAAITGHKITNLVGTGDLGRHIDIAAVGAEARQSTPLWLTKLLKGSR